MDCKNENGCDGELDFGGKPVVLMTGCTISRHAYPCGKCGRLHFLVGCDQSECVPINNRQGHRAFLEGDDVVNRDDKGVEQSRL